MTIRPIRAVSTWSLHRALGRFAAPGSAIDGGPFLKQDQVTSRRPLLDLVPEFAPHGYRTVQICHFHLESRDPAYLGSMGTTLHEQGIEVDMLLIDEGDLTDPNVDRQFAWYDEWLDAAETLGARRARIGAGRKTPTPELLRQSGERLAELASRHPNVRVVTENWLETTPDAESMLAVLDAADGAIGLLVDLGNWKGSEKYAELAGIASRAESCHAKCHFTEDGPDEMDFRRSLGILRDAGFDGPLALIYDGPDPDEWTGLDREWQIVESVWA